mgnify:CR=1 FL=1
MGAIGYFLAATLFFTALKTMDSGLAIVIWYCNPVMVVLAAWLFRGVRPGRVLVLCVALSVAGVGIAAGQLGGADAPAVLYVLGSSVAYVFYTLTGERVLHGVDLTSATAVVFLGTTCSLATLWASGLGDFRGPDGAPGWAAILAFAVAATVVPTVTDGTIGVEFRTFTLLGVEVPADKVPDFVTNALKTTYPPGLEVSVYRASTLFDAESKTVEGDIREYCGFHIYTHPERYRVVNLEAPDQHHRPHLHLEVDTEEDFQVVAAVYRHFGDSMFSLDDVVSFADANPSLDRKSTRLNSSHVSESRMPSSA